MIATLSSLLIGAMMFSQSWAMNAHDLTHTFTFGGDPDNGIPPSTVYNKGVHFDERTNHSYQLYSFDQDIHPELAARQIHEQPLEDHVRRPRKPGRKDRRNFFDKRPFNHPPEDFRDQNCAEDKPCANDLDEYMAQIGEWPLELDAVFCRHWQQTGIDEASWEHKYNYHECGTAYVPWVYMMQHGMLKTSDLVLALMAQVFGVNTGRAMKGPHNICVGGVQPFCMSWSETWFHEDNHLEQMTIAPTDMEVLRDMSMMCLHNGHSAAGNVRLIQYPFQIAICFSDRPRGCFDNICTDNFQVRFTSWNPGWAGERAIARMILGGDHKGPRFDVRANPERVRHVTGSLGTREPWILTNDTLKWILDGKADKHNPYSYWGPTGRDQDKWTPPSHYYAKCIDEFWPDWIWC